MKVAIPHWHGRISPVFDVAGRVLIVEIEPGVEQIRQDMPLTVEDPLLRAARLAEGGTDLLICGSISRAMEQALVAAGVAVMPQTCGDVEQVLAAFMEGRLRQDTFLSPGCRCRREPSVSKQPH